MKLQSITGRQLTKVDEPFWRESLAKYPWWKLEQLLADYNGAMNHGVFVILDAMRGDSQSVREATGYNSKQITNYSDPEQGKFYLKMIQELLLMGLKREPLEQAVYWLMRQKYPDWNPGE